MLPRLYPFVTHTMESVALSTVNSINDALASISSFPAASSSSPPSSSSLRQQQQQQHQRLQTSIATALREAWTLLVQSAIFDRRQNVARSPCTHASGIRQRFLLHV